MTKTLDELAKEQGVEPVHNIEALKLPIWEEINEDECTEIRDVIQVLRSCEKRLTSHSHNLSECSSATELIRATKAINDAIKHLVLKDKRTKCNSERH